MTNLSVFNFESHEVRFVGTPSDPWWVAADLCAVLDIQNVRQNLAKLDNDEKGVCTIATVGGRQELAIVNESAMYQLILSSRKPNAKKFRKWLTSEVIPAIRKTGIYAVNGKTSDFKAKVADIVNRRRELRQKIEAIKEQLKQLESEHSQLDVEVSKLYVLNNHGIGEEYAVNLHPSRCDDSSYIRLFIYLLNNLCTALLFLFILSTV